MVHITLDELGQDAKEYFDQVERGETLVITRADHEVAEIRPVCRRKSVSRPSGLAAGEFVVPDDFDAPLPNDVLDAPVN